MTSIQAIILGLIQGLTEFLPVSSSGHLVIFQKGLGFNEPPLAFDVLVHTATLVAIIVFFWQDLLKIDRSRILAIGVGTIPTAVIGLLLEKKSQMLFNDLSLVGGGLLITSLLLISTKFNKRRPQKKSRVKYKSAFLIGVAQGIAVIPGISRSGATIVSGLWLGLERKEAVTFAFILAIPAIIGAQVLKFQDLVASGQLTALPSIAGFVTAAVSGWISLKLLKLMVNKARLHRFAYYTLPLAFVLLFS